LFGGADNDAGRLSPGAVTFNPWQMTLLGPPTVTIHDNRDVPRQRRLGFEAEMG
jgi:hypothetical protein